jgi:seryl-tRNA synthetase
VIDIKWIREQPELVKQRLAARNGGDDAKIDEVLQLDEQRRHALKQVEDLKALRNKVSKEIGALMGQKKLAEAEAKKAETRTLGDQITALDKSAAEAEAARDAILIRLPNPPHASVPLGKSSADNPEVKHWGAKPEFAFTPKSHVDLCASLKLVDFERGAKLSGSGFLLYTNWGARLERALIQFLLDLHTTQHGYTEVAPPHIVSRDCMVGVGQFPKFEDQAYAVREGLDESTLGKLYLLPTAEAPVANIHREEILEEAQLPINYCAYSPCFRAEAGAAGVGTRGMIRVHQFDKVELVKVVRQEDGYAELEKMLANAEKVLQLLGLHYRVVLLCTGDMGFASAKTYDIEVWAPGQNAYLEVSSCSNTDEFQARRMNLRYRTKEKIIKKGVSTQPMDNPDSPIVVTETKTTVSSLKHPHLLNGSGTALARLFVALIETYQQADGSVLIPEPLRPYLRGADKITA